MRSVSDSMWGDMSCSIRGGLIGNPVPSKDFDDVFRGAHNRGDIEAHVNGSRQQAFLFDFVSRECHCKDRANDGDGLD